MSRLCRRCVDTDDRVPEAGASPRGGPALVQQGEQLNNSLALLNNVVAFNMVQFVDDEKLVEPGFQFKHLKLLSHFMADVHMDHDPKVVRASIPDFVCRFVRDLFFQWCSNHKN